MRCFVPLIGCRHVLCMLVRPLNSDWLYLYPITFRGSLNPFVPPPGNTAQINRDQAYSLYPIGKEEGQRLPEAYWMNHLPVTS